MKKFISILILLLAGAGLDSCHKDKDVDTPYTLLQGTWQVIQLGMDSNNNGKLDADEKKDIEGNDIEHFNFNEDGTGVHSVIFNGVGSAYPFTWQLLSSDNISATDTPRLQRIVINDTLTADIETLTTSRLVLKNYTSPALSWYIMKKQ